MRYDHGSFEKIVRHFRGIDHKSALWQLVLQTRGPFGCNRKFLFGELAEAHQGDAQQLNELWLAMQEESIEPTEKIRRIISKAFRADGREDPFPRQQPQKNEEEGE